jgi:hypothetical protein
LYISPTFILIFLILFVSSLTFTDTAVPEPRVASPVQKRASFPVKKSTRKGHVRKVFTPEAPPQKDKSKLVPKKGETRKGMNHCGRRTRGKNKRNRRRRGDFRSSRRRGGRKDCIPLSRCPNSVGSSTCKYIVTSFIR